jgi:hypothetical protein
MSSIQKTLDSLQPYVIGIRYAKGVPIVDVVYKEGWTVIETKNISKVKGDEAMNYYMIYSEIEGIGLDDLLEDVKKTISHNIEREKKHDLLRAKINELKEIFKRTPLSKLASLKFTFKEDDLIPSLNEFDSDIDEDLDEQTPQPQQPPQKEEYYEEELPVEEKSQPSFDNQAIYLDENRQPIEMSEEEIELMEEEARAKKNLEYLANKNGKKLTGAISKIELPPRPKKATSTVDVGYETDCDCGPNEACDKCIDSKGF